MQYKSAPRYFFSINIQTLKKKENTKVLHSAVSSKAGKDTWSSSPTPDETYNSKTILQKENKLEESEIAWRQIICTKISNSSNIIPFLKFFSLSIQWYLRILQGFKNIVPRLSCMIYLLFCKFVSKKAINTIKT